MTLTILLDNFPSGFYTKIQCLWKIGSWNQDIWFIGVIFLAWQVRKKILRLQQDIKENKGSNGKSSQMI
jgi:hypothetical protein